METTTHSLTEALALAAIHPTEKHLIPCHSLEFLLDYLTQVYMPGKICDLIRSKHDCLAFTTDNPMPWPLPNVIFAIRKWDCNSDDIEVYSALFVEANLHRWGYHSESERIAKQPPYNEPWEDFNIAAAFPIGQLRLV